MSLLLYLAFAGHLVVIVIIVDQDSPLLSLLTKTLLCYQNTIYFTSRHDRRMHASTGPEAQHLLQQATHHPSHTSLVEFTRLHPQFTTPSGYASVLSTHSHAVGGSMVNTLLVKHTEPAAHLDVQQVSSPLGQGPYYIRDMPCCFRVDFLWFIDR